MYDVLKKQLSKSPKGWFDTNLFQKEKHPPLDANKFKSLGRLNSLLHDLERNDHFNAYNDTIRDQQENEALEKLDEKSQCQNNEYYIPHKTIVRKTAQTTKVRVIPQQKVVLKMCH